MPLWKITDEGPAKGKETKIKQEKLLEEPSLIYKHFILLRATCE
jgi:hypothetical protein